jgi:hypothetical protein
MSSFHVTADVSNLLPASVRQICNHIVSGRKDNLYTMLMLLVQLLFCFVREDKKFAHSFIKKKFIVWYKIEPCSAPKKITLPTKRT